MLAHVNANIFLVQMRERLMAENRQKYQRVKKVGSEMVQYASVIYFRTLTARLDSIYLSIYIYTYKETSHYKKEKYKGEDEISLLP